MSSMLLALKSGAECTEERRQIWAIVTKMHPNQQRYGCASTRKKRGTLLAVGRLVPVTVLEARIQSVTGVQLMTSLLPRTRYAWPGAEGHCKLRLPVTGANAGASSSAETLLVGLVPATYSA